MIRSVATEGEDYFVSRRRNSILRSFFPSPNHREKFINRPKHSDRVSYSSDARIENKSQQPSSTSPPYIYCSAVTIILRVLYIPRARNTFGGHFAMDEQEMTQWRMKAVSASSTNTVSEFPTKNF